MRERLTQRGRQRLRTVVTVIATAMLIAPAAALATHGFNDVSNSDFFHAAVDWMKDNGVTVGCNPPANSRYCPDQAVTRGELAVFLERLDSKDVFLRPGEAPDGSGGDAETLDGKDSTDFLGRTEKAADADMLDGIDGADFTTEAEIEALSHFAPVATLQAVDANLDGNLDNAAFRSPITDAPTMTKEADGQFLVDFPGIEVTSSLYLALCTPISASDVNVTVVPNGGDLQVYVRGTDGNLTTDDRDDFTCLLYEAGP